jgi:hypothetical protein
MVPQTKVESHMSDETHELSIDELDAVSGGQVSTATVIAPIQAYLGFIHWAIQRANGSMPAGPFGR